MKFEEEGSEVIVFMCRRVLKFAMRCRFTFSTFLKWLRSANQKLTNIFPLFYKSTHYYISSNFTSSFSIELNKFWNPISTILTSLSINVWIFEVCDFSSSFIYILTFIIEIFEDIFTIIFFKIFAVLGLISLDLTEFMIFSLIWIVEFSMWVIYSE